jgi:hypothetical protein
MTLVVDRLQDDGTGNSDAVQDIIDGRAKASLRYDQSNTTLVYSFNISSSTDQSTGEAQHSFTNNMLSADDYAPSTAAMVTSQDTVVVTGSEQASMFDTFARQSGNLSDETIGVSVHGTLA